MRDGRQQSGGSDQLAAGSLPLILALGLSLQKRSDVDPEGPEGVGVEAICFAFRCAEEIADGSATQPVEETQDSTFLNDQREPPIENGLRTGIVADRDSDRDALAHERPA